MSLTNKRILIAPYSNMSESLNKYLLQVHNIQILGFIDKNKRADNIFSIDEAQDINYDKILIISPNHALHIYKEYINKGIKKNTIQFITYKNSTYKRTYYSFIKMKEKLAHIYSNLQIYLQKNLKKLFENQNHILFIAPDFIDLNIKDFYLYISEKTSQTAVIATNNKQHLNLFQQGGFNTIYYPSLSYLYHSLKAKVKVLDHNPIGAFEANALINSTTVQIWHGIPLKKIGHLTNYKKITYDLVISTSDFVSDYAFSKLFEYKKIINSGYPRNDILCKTNPSPKDLILVHQEIYTFVKNTKLRTIIYMPTWRGDGFSSNPIDLDDLNKFAKDNDLFIIFKMHPFIRANSFFGTINSEKYLYAQNYKYNLLFYPSTDDIYPLLPLSKLLITDYSSVYFDYLLLNKPILFFIYDIKEYLSSQGDFMLDFNKFTPGLKPKNTLELKESILLSLNRDNFDSQREELKDKLFNKDHTFKSSQAVSESLKTL